MLLLVIAIGALGPVTCSAAEFTLRKHPVRLIEVQQGDKRYWYDDRVPAAEAKALSEHFRRNADDPVPFIYAVPGAKGYFVVSSWDNRSAETDFGRRLYLVRRTDDGYVEIDRTNGAGDSYILRPVFFTGHGKILILAETGTEYSWGLMVYEIAQKRLTCLGPLDAAIEGEFDAEAPTPFATVKYTNGRRRVEFAHDLVLDPGGLKEKTIRREGKQPIVFEYDGRQFAPKAGTYLVEEKTGKNRPKSIL